METVRIMKRVDFSRAMGAGDFWVLPVYFETEKHCDGSISVTFEAENNHTITNLFNEINESEQALIIDLISKTGRDLAKELTA
jgi:hypothetical protein